MTASNKVEIELTARDQSVISVLQKIESRLDATDDKLKKIANTSKGAEKAVSGIFSAGSAAIGGFVASITGIGGVLAGVQQAIAAISAEAESLRRKGENARVAQMDAADAVRLARIAMSPDATLQDRDLESTIVAIAARNRTTVQAVSVGLQTTFSAKGDLTNADAIAALEEGLKLTPKDAGTAATLGGRLLDLSKGGAGTDFSAIAGFVQRVQGASRITSPEKVGANLVPAIVAGMQQGDTAEQAAELAVAINQGLSDEQGAITRTAAIQLGSQLKDFVPTRKSKDERGAFSVPADQIAAFDVLGGPTERLQFLQQHPEIRRAFLAKSSFDATAKTFVESLVGGSDVAMRAMRAAQAGVGRVDATTRGLQEQKIRELQGGQFQVVSDLAAGSAANVERFELGKTGAGRTAAVRKVLSDTLDNLHFASLDYVTDSLTDRTPARLIGGKELGIEIQGVFQREMAAGKSPFAAGTDVLERAKAGRGSGDRDLLQAQQDLLLEQGAAAGDPTSAAALQQRRASRVKKLTRDARALQAEDTAGRLGEEGKSELRSILATLDEQTRLMRQDQQRPQVPTARPAAQHGRNND